MNLRFAANFLLWASFYAIWKVVGWTEMASESIFCCSPIFLSPPLPPPSPAPCCCYCLNGDSVLKLLLRLPEKKHHPWSQQTGDKREGQAGCSLELKKKEHVIIKQTSSLLQPWSFLAPFYCFYHGQRCLVCNSQVFSNSQCSVSEDKLTRKWAPFD